MIAKHKLEILLIEDESDYLSSMLPSYGYEVTCIRKPDEAVGFLANNNFYNLVILDTDISNGAGWSVLREIKMNPYLSDIPVLIFVSDKDTIRMSMDSSSTADDYIIKPFLLPNLVDKIESVILHSKKSIRDIDVYSSDVDNVLTQKEKDVLLLLNKGENIRAISQKLGLNVDIVKTLERTIYTKLNIFQDGGSSKDSDFDIENSQHSF